MNVKNKEPKKDNPSRWMKKELSKRNSDKVKKKSRKVTAND